MDLLLQDGEWLRCGQQYPKIDLDSLLMLRACRVSCNNGARCWVELVQSMQACPKRGRVHRGSS